MKKTHRRIMMREKNLILFKNISSERLVLVAVNKVIFFFLSIISFYFFFLLATTNLFFNFCSKPGKVVVNLKINWNIHVILECQMVYLFYSHPIHLQTRCIFIASDISYNTVATEIRVVCMREKARREKCCV